MNRNRTWSAVSLALIFLIISALACSGTVQNLRIDGLPQYICPSSTPRPTHTQLATNRPLWLPYFASNLSWYQVAPNFNTIYAQWTGQNAGTVYLSYSGSMITSPRRESASLIAPIVAGDSNSA